MDRDGRPVDRLPINAGDIFRMVSGRHTTPFPKKNLDVEILRWLAYNVVLEIQHNNDDFNGPVFNHMYNGLLPKLKKDRIKLSQSDMDTLNMYLWEYQPQSIKSILKPIT